MRFLVVFLFLYSALGFGQTISSVNLPTVKAGGAGFTLKVFGTGFVKGSVIRWNGTAVNTTYISSTQLNTIVPPAMFATPGSIPITVQNPPSNTLTLKVVAPPVQVTVTPSVSFQQVFTGPMATYQNINITGSAYTAAITTDSPWLILSRTSGAATDPITLSFTEWRVTSMAAATYTATVAVTTTANGQVTNVPVTLQIVPLHDAPTITYLADPTLCTQQPGYIDKDLCVTPKDTFPLTPGTTYVDQTYGATVKILTDGPVSHPYSTPNPLSANNKYILTYDNNGWINVMLVADGSMAGFHAGTSAQSWWDVTDDDTFYYPNGPRIMKHSVSTGAESAVVDYTGRFTGVTRGGTGDSSKDNWISFWSSPEHNVCAVNLATTDTYCADYTLNFGNLPIPVIDFTLISKGVDTTSGKRYVIINGWPSNMIYTVNMTTKALDFEYRGPELPRGNNNHNGVCDPGEACWFGSHTDTLEVNGIQYMVFDDYYNSPCEFDIQTVQLNKGASLIKQMELGGGRKSVFNLWSCGPGWVDEHVACAKNAPYCVISTQSYGRASTDTTPIVNTPHDNAIIVMTGNGDGITPIAKSHTIKFTDAGGDLWYWGIPRASISNDGSCVVWDSDYGTFQQRVSISCWK